MADECGIYKTSQQAGNLGRNWYYNLALFKIKLLLLVRGSFMVIFPYTLIKYFDQIHRSINLCSPASFYIICHVSLFCFRTCV
jgi:hypothetical protein